MQGKEFSEKGTKKKVIGKNFMIEPILFHTDAGKQHVEDQSFSMHVM
jgi:hypothetical protein